MYATTVSVVWGVNVLSFTQYKGCVWQVVCCLELLVERLLVWLVIGLRFDCPFTLPDGTLYRFHLMWVGVRQGIHRIPFFSLLGGSHSSSSPYIWLPLSLGYCIGWLNVWFWQHLCPSTTTVWQQGFYLLRACCSFPGAGSLEEIVAFLQVLFGCVSRRALAWLS